MKVRELAMGNGPRATNPKSKIEKMSYLVVVERGDTGFGAYVPDLPGCVAVGDTEEEVLRLVQEAVVFHIEALKERGLPVPEPRSRAEVVPVGS